MGNKMKNLGRFIRYSPRPQKVADFDHDPSISSAKKAFVEAFPKIEKFFKTLEGKFPNDK